ncbi:hypothetical protein Avbf_18163 [Armadillidium vulgare]|nr:hypothetical protein Avbf_18163 [Armadillidium vulgare]
MHSANFLLIILLNISDISYETFALTIMNTSEIQWKFRDGDIGIDAKVPGGVYGSLMDSGKLTEGDFYYRFNDINYRNYSYRNWSCFQLPTSSCILI